MPIMIYFLGGPPRVGKSIIAKVITREYGISALSTDSLGASLESVLEPEAAPDLFAVSRFNERVEADRVRLMAEKPTTRIEYQLAESAAVWRAVGPFAMKEQDEGRDLVVEGVAVLPELVAQLDGIDYRAVFVGYHGKENIQRSAMENSNDWMSQFSDAYIDAFAIFVAEMSSYVEKEARKYGFEYIEMNGKPFHDAVAEVVNSLIG